MANFKKYSQMQKKILNRIGVVPIHGMFGHNTSFLKKRKKMQKNAIFTDFLPEKDTQKWDFWNLRKKLHIIGLKIKFNKKVLISTVYLSCFFVCQKKMRGTVASHAARAHRYIL